MKYISERRRKDITGRLRNQALRIHMLKSRHSHIVSQLGEQMAQVQATCDIALAADSDRLLATASRLASYWLENGSPHEEIENEIEKLLSSLEKRTYPSRWIVDFKSSEPPIDGVVSDEAD